MSASQETRFSELLARAITEPGLISAAYRAFHNYSVGNQILAWMQCAERGLTPGPICTFQGWKEKRRHVRRGEKAIVLCQPVTITRKPDGDDRSGGEPNEAETFTKFVYRPHWFVLAQTDGEPLDTVPIPEWDVARALSSLNISQEPFAHLDGNCQGYARERAIAVSPVAAHPHKTRFHELAHVVLGHTSEGELNDDERTPRSLREVEAEAVAMLCLEALGLPDAAYCRGYIQSWNQSGEPIPEKSSRRILKAADQILKAGSDQSATDRRTTLGVE
jgi:antirestriction protein ArdC